MLEKIGSIVIIVWRFERLFKKSLVLKEEQELYLY